MKSRILKTFNAILIMLFSIFPLVNVKALDPSHRSIYKNLDGLIPESMQDKNYNMGPGSEYHLTQNWIFHEVRDSDYTLYLAYCLNHGKSAPNTAGSVYGGIDSVIDNNGNKIGVDQQEMLKNVLASGYHKYNVNIGDFINSADNDTLYSIIATQIIVWEIMSGGRTNYELIPNNLPSNSYTLVHSNMTLETKYQQILNTAKSLSEGAKPESFNKTYTLHWNDSESAYSLRSNINVGNYRVDTSMTPGDLIIDGTSSLDISSDKYFSGNKTIYLKYVLGSTGFNTFRWFSFNKKENQNLALAIYGTTKTGEFYVNVEKGSFTLSKFDDKKEFLKGAEFDLYKCSSSTANDCTKETTISLKDKAYARVDLSKSGIYMFRETKVPYGFDPLPDFFVNFTIEDDNSVKAKANYDFLTIDQNNLGLQLNVTNEAKSFMIKKVDGTDPKSLKEVKGVSFKITDLKGNVMKFTEENGVYRYSKDGTIDTLRNTNLSTYTVKLLPQGEYILEEVNVPYPFNLSSDREERKTKFRVDKDANLLTYNYSTKKYSQAIDATIVVKNFKTKVQIIKNGYNGKMLEGVVFELYGSDKTTQVAVKNLSSGVYEYNRDSNPVPIQLVTNKDGKIIINYLPEGTYWLKEVVTVEGHEINEANEWTNFKVEINRDDATTQLTKAISNAKSEFCFYKMDEDGNYLDDGKFKLQIYNEKVSRFEDIPLIYNEKDNVFTIDDEYKSDIYTFSPLSNGQTCFKDVPAKTRYRVVEIEAPEGFILPKINETQAELIMDKNGYATGSPVIINRKITVGEGAEAQAELIINIQTGQNRIHYMIIIGVLLLIITALIILNKKINKK